MNFSHHFLCPMTLLSFCASLYRYSVCRNNVILSAVPLLPRLLLFALCLLCMLIVIPTSEPLPDYRWFPADNWTVNEIWWTDGPSPWGQLPCPLWLSGVGVEVGQTHFFQDILEFPYFLSDYPHGGTGEGGFISQWRTTWMESFQSQQI